jgi:hypothetical protein
LGDLPVPSGRAPKPGEGEKFGLDGFMVMPPMLYKGDPRETMAHFRAVVKATRLPIVIYNNPISYANDLTPEMFAELADQKNFVAVKESSGDPRRITDLRNVCGDRYGIFTGVDDLALEASILGLDGWVAGAGIAFPSENQYFWELTGGAIGSKRASFTGGLLRCCTWMFIPSLSNILSWPSRNAAWAPSGCGRRVCRWWGRKGNAF